MVAKPRHGPPSRRPRNAGRRRRPRSRPASEAGHELVKNARERGAGGLGQVRVDCGRFNGAVTEQDLDNSEIDAAFDQPSRIAVAQTMKRNAGDADLACGDGDAAASAPRPIGPSPAWLGKSHRGFLWVVQ